MCLRHLVRDFSTTPPALLEMTLLSSVCFCLEDNVESGVPINYGISGIVRRSFDCAQDDIAAAGEKQLKNERPSDVVRDSSTHFVWSE